MTQDRLAYKDITFKRNEREWSQIDENAFYKIVSIHIITFEKKDTCTVNMIS